MREKKPTELLQRIFELRRAKRINLDRLGEVMGGITPEGASLIENGEVPLKAEHIPAIAKLLGVATWELFIDYHAGETGPLSEQEKSLVLKFRGAASDTERKIVQDIVNNFAKR